jgi:hypothetical protein
LIPILTGRQAAFIYTQVCPAQAGCCRLLREAVHVQFYVS